MKRVEDVVKEIKTFCRSVTPRTQAQQLALVQDLYAALSNDLRLINSSILAHTTQFVQFRKLYDEAIASQGTPGQKPLPSLSTQFGALKAVMNTVQRDIATFDSVETLKNKLPYFDSLFDAMRTLRGGLIIMTSVLDKHAAAANLPSAAAFFAEFDARVYTPLKLRISLHDQVLHAAHVNEEVRAHIEIPLETAIAEIESKFS